jgi:hypothetical protein
VAQCERPSTKELWKKINQAREVFTARGFRPVDPSKLAANFTTLNLFSSQEQSDALLAALQEITPQNYSGARPPDKSYEVEVRGDDLFAFAWTSNYFGRRMYFKFCLHADGEGNHSLCVASLHKENIGKKKGP